MNCQNCGIEIEGKRVGAKFCSNNCRVTFSRKASVVTDNVTFSEPAVTDKFEFYTNTRERVTQIGKVKGEKSKTRTVKYWYDVPLGAIPLIKKDWPKMPSYMNGRQYFLWWKNEFKTNDKQEPIIHNPFPTYDRLEYKRMDSRMGT